MAHLFRGVDGIDDSLPSTARQRCPLSAEGGVAHWHPVTSTIQTATATLHTNRGDIKIALFGNHAPKTVANFVGLAQGTKDYSGENASGSTSGPFYDGVVFHRIINGFMVQTGDPTGTGRGGPGYKFRDELSGPQGYTKGTLAMANAGPNTQGSQFFICHGTGAERLPKAYTIFGRVTEGQDVLDKIAGVQVRPGPGGENSSPVDPPKIESIEIAEA
jgi:peptidyl-prolyl cis-trans isomerase A (cyclophilin A)